MSLVTVEKSHHPGVTLVTLNRAERHNALSKALIDELDRCIDHLRDDAETRCFVLTGAGERSFCAGADILEQALMTPSEAGAHMRRGQRLLARLESLPKPSIVALNGLTLGGGLELALACDIRLAAIDVEVGLPEAALATIPGWGGTPRLMRLVGPSNAKLLVLTAKRISAAQAMSMGLVNAVHASNELVDAALTLAAEIAAYSPAVIASIKSVAQTALVHGLEAALEAEAGAAERLWGAPEQRSAWQHFKARSRRANGRDNLGT